MINSLENGQFFSEYEIDRLTDLGLWKESQSTPAKLAFAGLMLAPIMQIVMKDGHTSMNEFTAIESFVKRIRLEFELATQEDIDSIGMEMGMLPMVPSTWNDKKFLGARAVLAGMLERLTEREAHQVRNALAKAALDIAKAEGGHLITLRSISKDEKPLIHSIVQELRLQTTGGGLELLDKTE
ncbi:MAG TPA: hypothetical protein VGM92_10275 [Candidatus Kapabacteria bacterium]|jgi:hypothetical protein